MLLKLQPYRQISIQGRSTPKLAPQYHGPFQVVKTIGSVAYELALPANARIHLVFHIFKLKPFRGTLPSDPPQLSPLVDATRTEL